MHSRYPLTFTDGLIPQEEDGGSQINGTIVFIPGLQID